MAKPLRPKRGTAAKNDAFTGLASEITIDTDKHSIRVHDGVTAGGHEILPKDKVLTTEGGNLTGTIMVSGSTLAQASFDNGVFAIRGGTVTGKNPRLVLYGPNNPEVPGGFMLHANDGVNGDKTLLGTSDGGLAWDGKFVITNGGGNMSGALVYSSGEAIRAFHDYGNVTIRGGTAYQKGAQISFYGKDHESYPGWIHAIASDGTNQKSLYIRPDGTFTFNGDPVATYKSDDAWYMRFSNGLMIQRGTVTTTTANTPITYTFKLPFKNAYHITSISVRGASGSSSYASAKRVDANTTATGVSVQASSANVVIDIIAFGLAA